MTTLKPLIEYIEYLNTIAKNAEPKNRAITESLLWVKLMQYVKEIKTPLSLSQFIPCRDGKPLEKPDPNGIYTDGFNSPTDYPFQVKEYETALSKVLFKGWRIEEETNFKGAVVKDGYNAIRFNEGRVFLNYSITNEVKTIESISHLNLELTQYGKDKLL